MLGSCRLNNKSMRNVRRTDAYQAIAIDLALLGIISKEECEMLLDGGIPSGIVLPDGSSKLTSEKNLPPKPDFIKVEPGDTEQPTIDVQSEPIIGVTVSDGATTNEQPSVDPVMPGDETQTPEPETGDTEQIPVLGGVTETDNTEQKPDVQPEPIIGVTVMPGDETQEPVNDEGRTESDN